MDSKQQRQIKKYVNLVFRRRWLMITFMLSGLSAGLFFYLTQPKIYESTSLLSYQQQKVNPAKMSPDVEAQIKDIVSTLSQLVTSRTSLESIIKEIGLYQEEIRTMPMEDVVERMRKHIEIYPSKTGDTFSITFAGKNPKQVARVTNMIAARFIEENLKYRQERASETSNYTQNELDMAKSMLDKIEAVMRDYKLKYYNEMPDQRDANMSRLIALQEQYQKRQESIQDLERTRVLVQDQIVARRQLLEENEKFRLELGMEKDQNTKDESDTEKLIRLRKELGLMQERYTAEHPAIKRLKRIILHLEHALPQEEVALVNKVTEANVEEVVASSAEENERQRFDQIVSSYEIQLKDIQLNIQALNDEKTEILAFIKKYEEYVAAAPIREAEWAALTREYGELKRRYDFLVSQNLEAKSALNLERKQQGSQFKVEDSGRIPVKPVKPDFLKTLGFALFFGFAAAGVLILSIDFLDTTFRDPEELEDVIGVEVICSIPLMVLPAEKKRKVFINIIAGLFYSSWFVGLMLIVYYWWNRGRIIF